MKKVHTIQEKLKERPELRPLIDWCIDQMKTDRAEGKTPSLERMKHEWIRQKDNDVPFFVKHKSIKYAIDNIGLRLQMLLDYENKGAAEGRDSADAHNHDDDGDLFRPSFDPSGEGPLCAAHG